MPSGYLGMVIDERSRIQHVGLKTAFITGLLIRIFFKALMKPTLLGILEDTLERSMEKQVEAFSCLFLITLPNTAFLEKLSHCTVS